MLCWLFPTCSQTLRQGSSSGPPPHSGDSDPLPAPGRLAGVSLNHGCPVALLPAKHIPHGCGTVTSPPFVELIALSRPLFRWITSPRADRAFLLRSPHCYSFCWAERVCVCLARRYSPKERASHGRAGVDNVPRVKVPYLMQHTSQVPDKHHIPQTEGHSWLFENLASIRCPLAGGLDGFDSHGRLTRSHAPIYEVGSALPLLPLLEISPCVFASRAEQKGCELR